MATCTGGPMYLWPDYTIFVVFHSCPINGCTALNKKGALRLPGCVGGRGSVFVSPLGQFGPRWDAKSGRMLAVRVRPIPRDPNSAFCACAVFCSLVARTLALAKPFSYKGFLY